MTYGNLLIIDDEPMLLKRLSLNLQALADQVFTAENGFKALELLNEKKIHCVICDINMPEMTGLEVIKKVRETKNEVPFIFYTGLGSQELMLEAVKYGAFDFLNKPELTGLEEVITKGLKEGFRHSMGESDSEVDFMSEYQKLLKDIEKSKQ